MPLLSRLQYLGNAKKKGRKTVQFTNFQILRHLACAAGHVGFLWYGTLWYGFWCVTICCLLRRRLLAAAVPIHIQNMVYRPGLTGLTGWLKSRQLTDLYTYTLLFHSCIHFSTVTTINYSAKNFCYLSPWILPTNSNFSSSWTKLNKRYHFRPIIGLPICSTIMKVPFIIFGHRPVIREGRWVIHCPIFWVVVQFVLTQVIVRSKGRVGCPPVCRRQLYSFSQDIGVSNHVLETRLVWQTAICCYYCFWNPSCFIFFTKGL